MTPRPASEEDLVALTVALAEINSVNPTLDPNGAGEAEIGSFVEAWMRNRGWDVHVDWPAPHRPNVVGVIRGGDGPSLMLNAHLDTVGAEPDAMRVSTTADAVVGRGVLDTKGGLAAALLAGACFDGSPPPGDIIIAAVCDEEANSIGTEALLESWKPDAAIVVEPTDLALGIAHRGFAVLEVRYRGRTSHTAHRSEGTSAIDAMSRLLADIQRLDASFASRPSHPRMGTADVQVTRIEGGTELFTVPETCRALVEIRTVSGSAGSDMERLRSLVDAARGSAAAEAEWIVHRDPFEVSADEPIVAVVESAVAAAGTEPTRLGMPFWTDAGLMAPKGIPTVVFGPGGHGIHSAREELRIADLVICHKTLLNAMISFATTPDTDTGQSS